jgi:hypothetical protein
MAVTYYAADCFTIQFAGNFFPFGLYSPRDPLPPPPNTLLNKISFQFCNRVNIVLFRITVIFVYFEKKSCLKNHPVLKINMLRQYI